MIIKRSNGKWRVTVKFRGVVVADRTFERRGDAVLWETEQKRLLHSGEFVSPAAGRITVRELADEYRDFREGQVSVRSWESDESALRVHIVPAFGRLPISSVTSPLVERFLMALAVSRSVRTAARVRTTLRGLFRYAVRTRRLRTSPAELVPLPHPDSRTGKVIEVHPFPVPTLLDVVKAQRELSTEGADVTLVLALTGLRFGEQHGRPTPSRLSGRRAVDAIDPSRSDEATRVARSVTSHHAPRCYRTWLAPAPCVGARGFADGVSVEGLGASAQVSP